MIVFIIIFVADAEHFDRISHKKERSKELLKREKMTPSSVSGSAKANGLLLPFGDLSDSIQTRRSHTITNASAENSPSAASNGGSALLVRDGMDTTPHRPVLRATPERK